MQYQPIGVFDSGYGGLTVLKEIVQLLPKYDYVYLGDNARSPYGPRSFEQVFQYTLEAVKWLHTQNCPLIILACNTASAKALRNIQQKYLQDIAKDKRVLGVIRPTAEVIGNFSEAGHIGILGTKGTVQSGSYLIEMKKFFPEIKVSQEACPMWVPLIENNEYDKAGADFFVKQHIDDLLIKDDKIDTILLACTHYPLLADKIQTFVPAHIKIVDQGAIVAKSLADYLQRHPEIEEKCSKTQRINFYTTGDTADFDHHAGKFYGKEITSSPAII